MPSRPTILPYASSNLSHSTASHEDLFSALHASNLAVPSGRHRSGSMTLPTANESGFNSALLQPMHHPSYHNLVDESVASTMASLGLDDHGQDPSPAATLPHRHRAYTVATRAPIANPNAISVGHASTGPPSHTNSSTDRLADTLSLGFSPFSPQTRSSLQRPRAISLGTADDTFSPFDMTSIQTNLPTHPVSRLSQQQPTQHHAPFLADHQRSLRMSRSSGNLLDLPQHRFDMDDFALTDDTNAMPSVSSSTSALLDSPTSTPSQVPSRALWIGNINPSISVNDLMQQFSLYGPVESARILSDKECGFVNFITVESAVAAKNDLETRLGSKLGGTAVRVGFGKADVALAMALTNEAGPNAQGPTRSLWVGNIPTNTNATMLQGVFQNFGRIESIRILSHKNCGFINFEHQEDAVLARKTLQNKEILGPGSGTVRIGFAKAPTAEDLSSADVYMSRMYMHPPGAAANNTQHPTPVPMMTQLNAIPSSNPLTNLPITPQLPLPTPSLPTTVAQPANNSNASVDTYQAAQWATAMMMTTMMMNASGNPPSGQPSLYTALTSERQFIMRQLGFDGHQPDRAAIAYFSVIPPVPELSADRTLEPLRLREIRKRLESGQAIQDVEIIAQECMHEIVELCSDYIGNVIVQRLFEHCAEPTKDAMLQRIAPYLAAIGVHKNGTWAVQKIIDHANSPVQFDLIRQYVAPYVPLLLLDQFGNYVVQCCLMRMSPDQNLYIFDAIVDKCWEIGQGRFGARAVRAILETNVVSQEQRIYCAAAIVQNAVLLTTNANGTLLLVWFLDTSDLPGRYKVLCPRLLPHLSKLCTHKLGSMTVFKLIQQQEDPDTSSLVLNTLADDPTLLDDVLQDQIHGVSLVQKIMTLSHFSPDRRTSLLNQVQASLDRLKAHHIQGYRKLLDELAIATSTGAQATPLPHTPSSPLDPSYGANSATSSSDSVDMSSWMKDPQAVAMMANMYAAAMTTPSPGTQTAPSEQPQPPIPDLPQLPSILKQLLQSSTPPSTNDTKNM
ncbi:ARM repeat-containing protein [Hesseltinella vesiculosa]|uniref:ARM repeat-containing protein n=1 Tax=Hesseltinella vesiculosa TaxID=101127 RepID=A0A1X2GAB7_9FUNG|nr:ARM repeat-containing protein [Hesseltinella vesiculosa]